QVSEVSDVYGHTLGATKISRLEGGTQKAIDEIKKIKTASVQTSEQDDTVITLFSEERSSMVVISGQSLVSSTVGIQSAEVEPSTTDNGFEVYLHLGEGLKSVVVTVELTQTAHLLQQ